jgi:MoxR-like ATPase
MRIRAGIPAIIMGETGCGKTFLVKMFSLLYNVPQQENENNLSEDDINMNHIYILKFHSGITDKDIINFLKETKKKINQKEMKEIESYMEEFERDFEKDEKEKEKEKNNTIILIRIFKSFQKGYKSYKKEEIKKSIEKEVKNRKIIIFFDEINTCNCLGLVKNIICDKN